MSGYRPQTYVSCDLKHEAFLWAVMATPTFNKFGRVYERGKAISQDIKNNIIQDIVEKGGDITTGYFPGRFAEVALKHRVKADTVRKIWKCFCDTGETSGTRCSGTTKHLQRADIEFVTLLKANRPSMSAGELLKDVNEFCDVPGGTSKTALGRALKQDMADGEWTWKRLTRPVAEKFTGANLNYCQEYLDYIKTVNPANLKFFDECGIKLPDVGRPNYGHLLIGTPAVEVLRNMHSPNITLNLLCGLDGVIYANTIDGSSNSITFLKFFEESSSISLPSGKPAYVYGDHIIMDNAPIHRNRAGQALCEWFDDMGCVTIFLPTYSPEFNPAENVFNKLKTILRRYEFRELLRGNLHVAVYEALKEITPLDIVGFFQHTGYIDI